MAMEVISSSPQSFLFSLCACFFILYGFIFPPVSGSFTGAGTGNETDMQSLLAFKDGITSDPYGALKSWNHSVHFCQWFGVTCGRRHPQRVTMLDLDGQELGGFLPPHIGNLSFLRKVWLRNNSLFSKIPPEIGRLRRLQKISLMNNSIGGEIPVNISRCSNLVGLELTDNNLGGKIPVELGMLSRLEELYIGENKIAGVIPSQLANISSLRLFYAPFNIIGGSITNELGHLNNLELFQVLENKLVGEIPRSVWNISSMIKFDVGGNQLGGRFPSELGGIIFPRISTLSAHINMFTGTIPVSISNASYLDYLSIHSNKLTGDVPPMDKLTKLRRLRLDHNNLGTAGKVDDLRFLPSLTNATNLEYIGLGPNNFGGVLPRSIGNLSSNSLRVLGLFDTGVTGIIPHEIRNLASLEKLVISNNKLTGNIPSIIGDLSKLQLLSLRDNYLDGVIPPSFGNLSILLYLYLDGNNFHGIIPPSFGNLSILLYLYLDGNNFHGTIPPTLGKCTNLLKLSIQASNLQGNLPREIFSLSSLIGLDLSNNHFTGYLPIEVGTLINLVYFDISQNMLSGKIPNTLGSCLLLNSLDMSSNNFSGILPSSLSSLRGLESFNISHNNLSGTVPKYLEVFPFLEYLDLSFNDFEGMVPDRGVFKNTTALNVTGNIRLCGGLPELLLPSCRSKSPEKKLRIKIIIGVALGVTAVVLFFLIFYLGWSNKPRTLPSLLFPRNSLLKLSYQNLYEATDGFSDANLIGGGGFGFVYKGLLYQGQQIVAVKVLNLQRQGASRSFIAECEALRRIKHRNLLKVLTACSSIDNQGNDFKAIVYEFMPNGSLDDWLHSTEIQDEMQVDGRNFDLSQRLDVCIGVAYALEYLHHRCEEQIVHCDLKPSNILLDHDMVAHVGDFGLAKLIQEGTIIQYSDNQSSTIGLRGSVGYVAPEYGMGNEVSTFGDIYSFGIVILELCTGKRPTSNDLFNGSLNLRDYVEKALPEEVEVVADYRLLGGGNDHEKIEECLHSLFKVGIACAQEQPRDRMAINDAIFQLHAIKKAFIRTRAIHVGPSTAQATPSQVPQ